MDRLVEEVREKIQYSWEHDQDNRRDAASDLRFLAGDQWPDWIRRKRKDDNRPMLTINRLPQFLRQVTNDIRQADLAIKTTPVDDKSDPDLAEIYNDLLRQIHYQSSAKHVYSDAAEHQAACGIGWFRVVTDYINEESFDQEIKVKRIQNPLNVYCDPGAVEPDRSDANWIIVSEMLPTQTFRQLYPGAAEDGMDAPSHSEHENFYWSTSDLIRRAEYWVKRPYQIELAQMNDGNVMPLDEIPQDLRSVLPIVNTRKATAHKVEQYMMSGADQLEDKKDWLGKHIPIVPVIGAEIPLEGKRYRHGVIRFARDSQTLYNYYRTAVAESIALAPKSPYLLTPAMIKGHKQIWDTANQTNRPYLPYNLDKNSPQAAPKREHPPEMPAAMMQEAGIASDDMKATTGIYDAALGNKSNETSGVAIEARDRAGDVANYHYADNLERSLAYAGRIMIDLIPKVYDNERVIRLRGEDDSERTVEINKMIMSEDGQPVMLNDLSAGRFDVRVKIGPSYTTKRLEATDLLMQMVQHVPGVGEVSGDVIVKSMDIPGGDEIAERIKRTMPPEIVNDPDDPDAPPPEPQGPPEPHPLEVAKAESEIRKNNAAAMKTLAEIDAIDGQMGNLGEGQPLPDFGAVNPELPGPELGPEPQLLPEQIPVE